MTTTNKRMQQRRGTSAEWAAKDPVLLAGELGYDMTTGGVKVGDGTKKWSELGEIKGSGGVAFPQSDGMTYAVRNGQWVQIKTDGTYTVGVLPPAIEEVNKQGELSVSFFIPYKFALSETDTTLADIAHREWRFPFAEGRIKRVTFKCMSQTGTAAQFDLRVNGMTALVSPVALTTGWQERTINTYIKKDDKVEFYVTQNIEATDLQVDLLIQVGNAALIFVGEADMEPNVYCVGDKKTVWGANGSDSPDGFFKRLYVPGATSVKNITTGGIVFKAANGKWHVVNDALGMEALGGIRTSPQTPTPIPFPDEIVDDVVDVFGFGATSSTKDSYISCYALCSDGRLWRCLRDYSTIYPGSIIDSGVSLISKQNGDTFAYVRNDGGIRYCFSPTTTFTDIPATNIPYGETVTEICGTLVLTSAKKVYNITRQELTENTGFGELQGTIEHIWTTAGGDPFKNNSSSPYLLFTTNDGALWGVGRGAQVGHGTNEWAFSLQKIFESIDVKDIVMNRSSSSSTSLLLTQEGKVYICGGVGSALVPSGHELSNKTIYTFHPIWENYKFSDIALNGTFVGIGEYLGEITNS